MELNLCMFHICVDFCLCIFFPSWWSANSSQLFPIIQQLPTRQGESKHVLPPRHVKQPSNSIFNLMLKAASKGHIKGEESMVWPKKARAVSFHLILSIDGYGTIVICNLDHLDDSDPEFFFFFKKKDMIVSH